MSENFPPQHTPASPPPVPSPPVPNPPVPNPYAQAPYAQGAYAQSPYVGQQTAQVPQVSQAPQATGSYAQAPQAALGPYGSPWPATPHPAPAAPATSAPRTKSLGLIALLIAAGGIGLAVILAGIAGARIGEPFLMAAENSGPDGALDLAYFSGVRGWVLLGEVAFWLGTITGIWALVQGIIALVQGRGRGAAIGAVIIAILGPALFFVVLVLAMALGYAATA